MPRPAPRAPRWASPRAARRARRGRRRPAAPPPPRWAPGPGSARARPGRSARGAAPRGRFASSPEPAISSTRLGARCAHAREGLEQRRLVGQRVQALDVEQQRAALGQERAAQRLRARASRRGAEHVGHRRVDDRAGRAAARPARGRARAAPGCRRSRGARRALRRRKSAVLAVVVPDLGAVVGEHVGPAGRARPGAPPPGSSRCWSGRAPRRAAQQRRAPCHQVSAASSTCGSRVARSARGGAGARGDLARSSGPRPNVRKRTACPRPRSACAQQVRQQRVGRLVRRQVRRDHEDLHAPARALAPRRRANSRVGAARRRPAAP